MKRISTRLVVSFLIVALLPTLPLSMVVRDLLERRFGPAISDPLEAALEAGLDESRGHLQELRTGLDRRAAQLAADSIWPSVLLLDHGGRVQSPDSLASFLGSHRGIPEPENQLLYPATRKGDMLITQVEKPDASLITVIQVLPEGMVERASKLTEGVSLLRAMKANEGRVVLSFVGPFLVVYGILILVALIAAFLWARQMVRPLEVLVNATRRVAAGDLEFRIPQQGQGEVGELVNSFDIMVSRLADQRRDLARLERAAAWRGMARTLAHEVKNPLTPILLAVNQARDKYPGEDETYSKLLDEVAEIVGEEVENLRALVQEFGDFARFPKPEPKPGDVGRLLGDVQQLYGTNQLELIGLKHAAEGWFDYNAVRRALINLIDNGLAASRESGNAEHVQLIVIETNSGVRLAIRDHGVGIAQENLAKIFEPDFTTKSNGMGLGLAIVENIVMGHGGRVKVDSVLGEGSTFTMELPLTPVTAQKNSTEDGLA